VLTNFKSKYAVDWAPFLGKKWTDAADTALPLAEWKRLAERSPPCPELQAHPLVKKVLATAPPWAAARSTSTGAWASTWPSPLVASGYPVRLSGEDCGRGTFTHRHAVLHDQNREKWDEGTYIPLQHVADNQAPFTVIDSILSEEAVLGFEYGYASAEPNTLTIWEAQFGDFVNGAQVVIDQFIASGEVKWGRVNGLTLMLPHGYEGQGPEHSSARLERFMQLAPTTTCRSCSPPRPARSSTCCAARWCAVPQAAGHHDAQVAAARQGRHLAAGRVHQGQFQTVIGEQTRRSKADKVKRVIACSGKVVLRPGQEARGEEGHDVAIIRVEQLYPFPHKAFATEMKKYPNATDIVWCQDEPQNQGAWFFVQHYIHENMLEGQKLGYAGRPASASPAVGYSHLHQEQQKALLDQAFGKLKGFVLTKYPTPWRLAPVPRKPPQAARRNPRASLHRATNQERTSWQS
jgi:2-oxoglutarate dehydrogenase E1 component